MTPMVSAETVCRHIAVPDTDFTLEAVTLQGVRPGPCAVITAGIHADEYVGVQALIELAGELDPHQICGTVVLLPLVNAPGFARRGTSMMPGDESNLNRLFPGDAQGTPGERLASFVFETFIRSADLYIDLHSGDYYEDLVPHAYYLDGVEASSYSSHMARFANVPYVVRYDTPSSGSACSAASVAGIASVIIERGTAGAWTPDEVAQTKNDVVNILRAAAILDGPSTDHRATQQYLIDSKCQNAPLSGCWYPTKKPGSEVVLGETLGEIKAVDGRSLATIIAHAPGVILYQTSSLNVIKDSPAVAYAALDEDIERETDHAEIDALECQVNAYWDGRSGTYSASTRTELASDTRDAWDEVLAEAIPHFRERPLRILDLGCGPGFFSILCAKSGHHVDAVDLSAEMLAQAANNAQSDGVDEQLIAFHRGDVTALPFADDSFDAIITRNLTWTLPDPQAAYKEWYRVLAPNGRLLVFDANWYTYLNDDLLNVERLANQADEDVLGKTDDCRATHTQQEACELLALQMPLTYTQRPAWDRQAMSEIGFSRVDVDESIWQRVWTPGEKAFYATSPLFFVCGIK